VTSSQASDAERPTSAREQQCAGEQPSTGKPTRANEPTRERVRSTIGLVGGYWRPLAAVARLQEELGELAELLATPGHEAGLASSGSDAELASPGHDAELASSGHEAGLASSGSDAELASPGHEAERRSSEHGGRLASELADLWIITTALADQFLGAVAEPDSHAARPPGEGAGLVSREGWRVARELLNDLVAAAGPIARIVNYYDGPKTPRSFDGWISLGDAIAEFHRSLASVAHAYGVDLAKAVEAKLDAIPAIDSGRFRAGAHDPSTAPSVERFRALPSAALEPGDAQAGRDSLPDLDIQRARLWGSPDWSSDDPASNLRAIVADLASFTKAAPWEGLEGYVIHGPVLPSKTLLDDWLARLLEAMGARDQADAHLVGVPPGTPEDLRRRLALGGLPLHVSVLCARHRPGDSGHPMSDVFLLLWPQR
jgi:hypothetical protein